jgi:secondary thiamine-phosphate synthase enzyme
MKEAREARFRGFPSLHSSRMRTHTEYLTYQTTKKRELVHLTPTLEEILARAAIQEGFMLVSAMHITAGVFVNDNESGLHEDIWAWLDKLAPFRQEYRHHRTGEDNGDAHLRSLLIHHEVIVPITKGKLDLGPWQQVFYAEFDGQRQKRVIVKTMGE